MSTEFTTKNLVSLFVPLLIGIIMIISGIIFLISDSNYDGLSPFYFSF